MDISLETIQISRPEPRAFCFIGTPGIGKSTLASLFPDPIFIATEKGLSGLNKIPHWKLKTFAELMRAIYVLYEEKHSFKTGVLDTVTKTESIIHAELLRREDVASLDKVGGGWYKWRQEALPIWDELLEGLDMLREHRGMEIVLLGHTIDKEVKPPDNEPYRKYTLDLLNPIATGMIFNWADVLGFYNYRIMTKVVDKKKLKDGTHKTTSRAIGTGGRIMYFDERPAFHAKNRYKYPAEMSVASDCSNLLELFGFKDKPKSKKETRK